MLKRVVFLAAGLALPALLLALCLPRLAGDFGMARARPALQAGLVLNMLPADAYADAAAALAPIADDNGIGLILRAEMAALASSAPANRSFARALVTQGLARAPDEPRGWVLLCELEFHLARDRAAACMENALFVAPFDWYSAGRRAVLAAYLYPELSPMARSAAERRVRLMWHSGTNPFVRRALYDVYNSPYGPALLEAAFAQDKPALRELNRWLILWRRYGRQW